MKVKKTIRKVLGIKSKHEALTALKKQAASTGRILVSEPLDHTPERSPQHLFDQMREIYRPTRILEVGTLQSRPGVSTHQHSLFPWVAPENYVKADLLPGPDVDVVCDLHSLPKEWSGKFNCFIANAVFEHLERPWIAAKEVARILAPGGLFIVGTHQCFPIHAYPSDYFRFSRNALRLIFEDAGLMVEAVEYEERCVIVPAKSVLPRELIDRWNQEYPSYILVKATGHKPQ